MADSHPFASTACCFGRASSNSMAIDPTSLLHSAEKNILELLHTDLELAFTFLKIAEDAPSQPEKRERNIENARKAYETTLKWLERMKPGDPDEQEIRSKLEHLGQGLKRLGVEL